MSFSPQFIFLLCMHKCSRHQVLLRLDLECQHDWLETFGLAFVKQTIGFWGEGMGCVSYKKHFQYYSNFSV